MCNATIKSIECTGRYDVLVLVWEDDSLVEMCIPCAERMPTFCVRHQQPMLRDQNIFYCETCSDHGAEKLNPPVTIDLSRF